MQDNRTSKLASPNAPSKSGASQEAQEAERKLRQAAKKQRKAQERCATGGMRICVLCLTRQSSAHLLEHSRGQTLALVLEERSSHFPD